MNRLGLMTAIWLGCVSISTAQSYTCTVLYPMTLPAGVGGTSQSPNFSQAACAGQTVINGLSSNGNTQAALFWPRTGGVGIELASPAPAGLAYTFISSTDGTDQVGFGEFADGNHALLWHGSRNSMVDLNPSLPGIVASAAYGVAGTQQVGSGITASGVANAMIWNGTAGSAVDVNPTNMQGIVSSTLWGTDGIHQVGQASNGSSTNAMMWSGTADSAVDLDPTSLTYITRSAAVGVGGNQQVGYGYAAGNNEHALLWTGTGSSAIDLSPTDLPTIVASGVVATNGLQQVGYGFDASIPFLDHAIVWSGSADSAVELDSFLPSPQEWQDTIAFTIDSAGNIYGTSNGYYKGTWGNFAIEWSPTTVPEPSATGAIMAFAVLLRRFRRSTSL